MSTVRNTNFGGIVTDGLVLNLDAARRDSYPRSGTIWNDISGNGHVGSLYGDFGFDNEYYGELLFDGTGDYVRIPQAYGDFSNPVCSYEIWCYPTSFPAGGQMLFMDRPTYNIQTYGVQLYVLDGTGVLGLRGSSDLLVTSTIGLNLNEWNHVVVNFSGSSVECYINNVYENLGTIAEVITSIHDLYIGKYPTISDTYDWNGEISTVRVYDRVLTSEGVLKNYNSFKGRFDIISNYLNDVYEGATGVYSLRRLKSTATNSIRVRRSSDDAEQDISFTGYDLNTASLETFCSGTDGYVTTIYDQDGSNNATQSTATLQPKIVASGTTLTATNGKPAILFDGSNDYLGLTSTIALTQLLYQSVVFDRETGAATYPSLSNLTNNIPTPFLWNPAGSMYSGLGVAGDLHDSGQPQTGSFLHTALRDSSDNIKMWQNGSTIPTKVRATTTANFDNIGNSNNREHAGYWQELVYWNTDQEVNRLGIETNTNNYYSIFSYLLDNYSGAKVAYSLRRLKATATNCIRVRRSSDNAEQNINFTGYGLDTTSLEIFCAGTNGYVTTWYDQSGNGNNASSATAADQPLICTSGVTNTNNGFPSLLCATDKLTLDSPISTTQLFYQHSVFDRVGGYSIGLANDTVSTAPYYWKADNKFQSWMGAGVTHATVTTKTLYLQTFLRTAADVIRPYHNNVARTTKIIVDGSSTLNCLFYFAGFYNIGDYHELIYWDNDQQNNRGDIDLDTNTFYSIY